MASFHCIYPPCRADWEGPLMVFIRLGYKCPTCGMGMCPGPASDFDEHGNRKPKAEKEPSA